MEPVSLIVTALIAGAAAGGKEAATAAVKDAYESLKALLTRRLGERRVAHAVLADVEQAAAKGADQVDAVSQEDLDREVKRSGADTDPELQRLAEELLTLLGRPGPQAGKYTTDVSHAQGLQVGDHNTQTNTFGTR